MAVTTDMDGHSRPQLAEGIFDIGADQAATHVLNPLGGGTTPVVSEPAKK